IGSLVLATPPKFSPPRATCSLRFQRSAVVFSVAPSLRSADNPVCAVVSILPNRPDWPFPAARAVELWAALRSLGRDGLRALVERNCRQAALFAEGLRRAGFDVLNDVVLNQVLVSFGTAENTQRVIREVQSEGTCWCGPT